MTQRVSPVLAERIQPLRAQRALVSTGPRLCQVDFPHFVKMESLFSPSLIKDSMDDSASSRRFFGNSNSAIFRGGGGCRARPVPLSYAHELLEEPGCSGFEEEDPA